MSGVYIKGMTMPKNCFECKLLDYTDTFKCRFRYESLAREHGINISRPDWCPLVPIPPHGRLIDADALMKDGWRLYRRKIDGHGGIYGAEMPLSSPSIPTIIEAEGEE